MADDRTYPVPGAAEASSAPSGQPAPAGARPTDESLVTTARGVDSWLTPEFLAAINRPGPATTPSTAAPTSGSFAAGTAVGLTGLTGGTRPRPDLTPAAPGALPRPSTAPASPGPATPSSPGPVAPAGGARPAGAYKPMTRSDIDALVGKWMSVTPRTPAPLTAPPPIPFTPTVTPLPALPTTPLAPAPRPTPISVTLPALRTPPPSPFQPLEPNVPPTPPDGAAEPATITEPLPVIVVPPIGSAAPVTPDPVAPTPPSTPSIKPFLGDLDQFLALSRPEPVPAPPVVAAPFVAETTPSEPVTAPPAQPSARVSPFQPGPRATMVETVPQAVVPPEPAVSSPYAPPAITPGLAANTPLFRAETGSLTTTGPQPGAVAPPTGPPAPDQAAAFDGMTEAERRAADRAARQAASMRAAYERQIALEEGEAAPAEAAPHPGFVATGTVAPAEAETPVPYEPATAPQERRPPPSYAPPRAGVPFGQSLARTLASTVVPGTGLFGSRSKRNWVLGLILLVLALALIGTGLYLTLVNPSLLRAFVLTPSRLRLVAYALIGAAVLWVVSIALTFALTHPRPLSLGRRVLGSLIVIVLSALVAAPLATGASYALTTASTVEGVFTGGASQTRPPDPPVSQTLGRNGRLNILLAGLTVPAGGNPADVRADTLIVASIDTMPSDAAFGSTVLIQVPSVMARTPFPADTPFATAYPTGFFDGDDARNPDFFVSALWGKLPSLHPELFTNTAYPGADATKLALGAALGLQIDYFMAFDSARLVALVDAMGGVTVNVNFAVGMGGTTANDCASLGTVPQGANQHLTGTQAFWFATSQCNDPQAEYGRMVRQQCLVGAVVAQAPTSRHLLTRYESFTTALSAMTSTDIPPSLLPRLADLTDQVKKGGVLRYTLTHGRNGFNTTNPNYNLVAQQIKAVIGQSATPPAGTPAAPVDICAYRPQGG